MPSNPDPHLALARLWAYQLADVDRAMSEFGVAEKLGAAPGRRVIEEQADAYRLRAQRLKSLQDVQTARVLYRRIPGFDDADRHAKELDAIRRPVNKYRARPNYRRLRWL